MGIVEVPLVIVGEDFVGLFGGFEPDLGFLALFNRNLVRVVRQRSLVVSFLDFDLGGTAGDAENLCLLLMGLFTLRKPHNLP